MEVPAGIKHGVTGISNMSCVRRSTCLVFCLLLAVASSFSTLAGAPLQFSGWLLELPETLVKTASTPDRLVLKLAPGLPGRAIITFYSPVTQPADPNQWLDEKWQTLRAGRRINNEDEAGQAMLLDGSASGPSRMVNTGDGLGLLQADAFIEHGRVYLVVVDAEGEHGLMAYMTLMPGMSLTDTASPAIVEDTPASPTVRNQPVFAGIKAPSPPGSDPSNAIDWNGPDIIMRTTADLEEVHVRDALGAFLDENRTLLGDVQSKPVSYATAMSKVRSLVGVEKNSGYLNTLRTHPKLQQVETLMELAASQLTAGSSPEALASLLVAHERWPNDTLVMFNLSATLASFGHVNESQALLDEIKRLGKAPAVSYGMNPQSALDYMQGYNGMRLGEYEKAAKLLRQLVDKEPYLAEAALTLALLEHELGNDARPMFLRGFYRRPVKLMKPGQTVKKDSTNTDKNSTEAEQNKEEVEEELDDVVALPAIHFVDLSRGQAGSLRAVPRPSDLDEALDFYHSLAASAAEYEAELNELTEYRDKLDAVWRKKIPPGLRYEYYEAIVRILSEANARVPEMQDLLYSLNEAINDQSKADERIAESFMEEFDVIMRRYRKEPAVKACPDIRTLVSSAHTVQMPHVKKVEIETRYVHDLWHRYATALGGMASDPDFRRYIKAEVELADAVRYYSLLTNMHHAVAFSPYIEACNTLERQAKEEADKKQETELALCDEKNKETRGYKLGLIKLEKSCEGISLSATNDLVEGLELTAEIKFDRDGWVQEKKVGASVGNDSGKLSGELTTDKDGNIKEGKLGVEVGAGGGKIKGEISRDSKGSTTIYTGKKIGGEVGAMGVKVGASREEGSGVTYDSNGRVTSAFTKSVSESSMEAGYAGISAKSERITILPGTSINRGSSPLPEFRGVNN